MAKDLFTFHNFDPEDYEKEIYEVLTFASQKIPGYPNAGQMVNLLDDSIIPLDRIYKVRVATETVCGVEPTYCSE